MENLGGRKCINLLEFFLRGLFLVDKVHIRRRFYLKNEKFFSPKKDDLGLMMFLLVLKFGSNTIPCCFIFPAKSFEMIL